MSGSSPRRATLVVAALSARALAQAAAADGFDVIALDLFGDADTRRASVRWQAIGQPGRFAIDPQALLATLRQAAGDAEVIGWIAGSGFDGRVDWLEAGAEILPLLGLAPALQAFRRPRIFFAALDALGVAHPPVAFDAPVDRRGWLHKDAQGSGGWHIHALGRPGAAGDASSSPWHYLQQAAPGTPMSATFIATGDEAVVLGCNELTVGPLGRRRYVYRGVIGAVAGDAVRDAAVHQSASRLCRHFGLRGLGSLDFLFDKGRVSVLEINARPPASIDIYRDRVAGGLIRAHLAALAGQPPSLLRQEGVRGLETFFAPFSCRLDAGALATLAAMTDCHDVPHAATRFDTGDPVCSVSARGDSVVAVRAALADRLAAVQALLVNEKGV